MSELNEPVDESFFDHDLHEVNKEIIRLGYLLNVDIADPIVISHLLNTPPPVDHEHFHKFETLRGLIFLRGRIRQERADSGISDGIEPTREPIYQLLKNSRAI
jgi:hypothetical protein